MNVALTLCLLATAQTKVPSEFPIPPGYAATMTETYDFSQYDFKHNDVSHFVEGKYLHWDMRAEPALEKDTFYTPKFLHPLLQKAGWKIVEEGGGRILASRIQGGKELWVDFWSFGSEDNRVTFVEKGTTKTKLELPTPAAKVEPLDDKKDIPYLAHYPGCQLRDASIEERASLIASKEGEPEQSVSGIRYIRAYGGCPAGGSNHEYVRVYEAALKKVGWEIIRIVEPSDTDLVARYAKNGRDIWINLHAWGLDQVETSVIDVGAASAAKALKAELDKKGRVAIYGIYFDTDSAKLRSDSEPALAQILELLKGDAALSIEIQGHTDDVGDDAHNQKLSDARAASVRTHLVAHGIVDKRLVSKGFGETKPVADNGSPGGRALNRRVELAKR